METPNDLIPMPDVLDAVGCSRRVLIQHIKAEGITVWQDGRDRRKRLIRRADLPKLTEPRPVGPREPTAV